MKRAIPRGAQTRRRTALKRQPDRRLRSTHELLPSTISPPWARAMSRAIDKPNPEPPVCGSTLHPTGETGQNPLRGGFRECPARHLPRRCRQSARRATAPPARCGHASAHCPPDWVMQRRSAAHFNAEHQMLRRTVGVAALLGLGQQQPRCSRTSSARSLLFRRFAALAAGKGEIVIGICSISAMSALSSAWSLLGSIIASASFMRVSGVLMS